MAPSFMPLLAARVFVPGYSRTVGLVKIYRWLFLSGRNQVCLSPSPELNDGDPSMTDRRLLHPNIVYHYTTFMHTPVVRYNLNSTCILYPGFHHAYLPNFLKGEWYLLHHPPPQFDGISSYLGMH